MKLSKFAQVMIDVKHLLEVLLPEENPQDLLNKHYMLIKPYMYIEPIQELALRIVKQEYPEIGIAEFEKHVESVESNSKFDIYKLLGFKDKTEFKGVFKELRSITPAPVYHSIVAKYEEDSFFSGPHSWQCDPFTGLDPYGRTYNGNF